MKVIKQAKSIEVKKYQSEDGIIFDTHAQCYQHEQELEKVKQKYTMTQKMEIVIPFANWDSDPEICNLYLLKDRGDYLTLKDYFHSKGGADYFQAPLKYPAALLVIGRGDFVIGYSITSEAVRNVEYFLKTIRDFYNEAKAGDQA